MYNWCIFQQTEDLAALLNPLVAVLKNYCPPSHVNLLKIKAVYPSFIGYRERTSRRLGLYIELSKNLLFIFKRCGPSCFRLASAYPVFPQNPLPSTVVYDTLSLHTLDPFQLHPSKILKPEEYK